MSTESSSNLYGADLAFVHDVGFGELARNAAEKLVHELRARGFTEGRVVELGCGSGIAAELLSKAGYSVYGIDQSEAMLEVARQRVPDAEFVHGSITRVALPECVGVLASGECFNYMADADEDRSAIPELFGRIIDKLTPGGVFVFDVATPELAPAAGLQQKHVTGESWAVLMEATGDRAKEMLVRHITTFVKRDEGYVRSEETHFLRLLPRQTVTGWLRTVGFRTKLLSGYGNFSLTNGLAGFMAEKPRDVSSQTVAVSLAEKFALISEHWRPKVVGELNGQEVKLVKFQGTFPWHNHEDADEMFLVWRGHMQVELRDGVIELEEGEFCIVPRGVEHRTVAESEAEVMLFEPASIRNTGDVIDDQFTAPNGVAI